MHINYTPDQLGDMAAAALDLDLPSQGHSSSPASASTPMHSNYTPDQLGDMASAALDLDLPSQGQPEDDPSTRPFRLLDLPRELRNRIYDFLAPDVTTLVLRSSGRFIIASAHPLELTSQQLRVEWLDRLEIAHYAGKIVFFAKDFVMAKLVRHLKKFFARTKGQDGVVSVEVRHDVSVAGVDIEKLTAWFKVVKGEQARLDTNHIVCGLPAVGQRRAFMGALLQLKSDVGVVFPEAARLVKGFEGQWKNGAGINDFVEA